MNKIIPTSSSDDNHLLHAFKLAMCHTWCKSRYVNCSRKCDVRDLTKETAGEYELGDLLRLRRKR